MKRFIKISLMILSLTWLNLSHVSVRAEATDYGTWGSCHFVADGSTLTISYSGYTYNGVAAATGLSTGGWLSKPYSYIGDTPVAGSNRLYFSGLSQIVYLLQVDKIVLGEGFTVVGSKFFENCSTLVSVQLPSTIELIDDRAFYNCRSLKSIYLPNALTEVGESAFCGCSSLRSIVLPNNVETIGEYCFSGCTNLKEVRMGHSVVSVGTNFLSGCINVTDIYCYAETPPAILGCNLAYPEEIELHVPCGSKRDYMDHPIWGQFDVDVPCPSMTYLLLTIGAESNDETMGSAIVRFNDQDYSEVVVEYVFSAPSVQLIATATEGCHFTQWDDGNTENPRTLSPFTSHRYIATFERDTNRYQVTFVDWNGKVLETQYVEGGHAATTPADPTRKGYSFIGWDTTFDNIQNDLTVTARYTLNSYTVQFVDWDGTILDTQTVNYGSAATTPSAPTREHCTFDGWDNEFEYITEDMVITAQYTCDPYFPYNLQATDNGNGTFTITWDPIDIEGVQYGIIIFANGNCISDSWGFPEASYVTNVLPIAGSYNGYLYVYDSAGNVLSINTFAFEVPAIEARDITVRVLIHPDGEFDTTNGVEFSIYNYNTREYVSYPAIDEGGSWYRYTFHTSDRAIQFKLGNISAQGITTDTCFQYIRTLHPVECDAVAHDYRILPESVNIISEDGRIEFSWDAVDIAERYVLTLRDSATNDYICGYYVYGTSCSIGIPAQYDSTVVVWSVYPASPIDMYYAGISGTAMLHKSDLELTNLKANTTDSVTYHFSWDSNRDSLLYVFTLVYSGTTLVWDTLSEQNYSYTLPYNGIYTWSIYAINASDKTVIGGRVYGENIQTNACVEPIVNLQGSVNGRTITYTWELNVPQVMTYLFRVSETGDWNQIFYSDPASLTSLVYDVEEDGVYRLEIVACIETSPGQYASTAYSISEEVHVFAGETVTLQANATEGGYIAHPNPSGEYAAGYRVEVGAYADEHYHFVIWSDGETSNWRYVTITGDTTITAIFEKDKYTVTFLNDDGSLIEENEWEYGSTPSCSVTPVKESNNSITYVFAGWSPQISAVTEPVTYTAVFTDTHVDIENILPADERVRKILRDGQILIIRGNKTYTITGQEL